MFLTKDWVFIHFPKTAGAWVAEALILACQTDGIKYFYDPVSLGHRERWRLQALRPFSFLGCIRHPCDWYVSHFEYRHWIKHQRAGSPLGEDPSKLSSLSFSEYLQHAVVGGDWSMIMPPASASDIEGLKWDDATGWMTVHFHHQHALPAWQQPGGQRGGVWWGMTPQTGAAMQDALKGVAFLRFESITEDLHNWLGERGFSQSAIRRAVSLAPFNVSPSRKKRPWQEYYSEKDETMVRDYERAIFEAFPEYA